MKIILNYPPESLEKGWQFFTFPMALVCLASFIKNRKEDTEVKLLHNVSYCKDNLVKTIKDYKPNIVGFSCDSANFNNCFELANLVKAIDKNTYVILGGIHATFFHRAILERIPPVDIIVRGEGEETLLEIIESIERTNNRADFSKIKGITYRSNDRVFVTPERPFIKNLDTLPFLSYDLIDMKKIESYTFPGWWPLHTARGCCYRCEYCATIGNWRGVYRFKLAQRVINEIVYCYSHYNIKGFFFNDMSFTINKKRTYEICRIIIEKKMKIKWGCFTRIDCVDKDLLKIMRAAGCRIIVYGIESLSNKMLKAMRKGYEVSLAIKNLNYTNKTGIDTRFELLLGFPSETEGTLRETLGNIKRLDNGVIYNNVNIFQLHPNSKIYNRIKDLNLVNDEAWFSGFKMENFIHIYYPRSFIERIYETKKAIERMFEEEYEYRQSNPL